jgi:hypothetical protein
VEKCDKGELTRDDFLERGWELLNEQIANAAGN